eukprot:4393216-Pleurochrysis_carterae.AAC.3
MSAGVDRLTFRCADHRCAQPAAPAVFGIHGSHRLLPGEASDAVNVLIEAAPAGRLVTNDIVSRDAGVGVVLSRAVVPDLGAVLRERADAVCMHRPGEVRAVHCPRDVHLVEVVIVKAEPRVAFETALVELLAARNVPLGVERQDLLANPVDLAQGQVPDALQARARLRKNYALKHILWVGGEEVNKCTMAEEPR